MSKSKEDKDKYIKNMTVKNGQVFWSSDEDVRQFKEGKDGKEERG